MAFRSLNIESLGLKAPLSHAAEVDAGARLLFISGLTAKTPGGETFAPGNAGAQAIRILDSIKDILAEAGGTMADIVKLTVYLCDISRAAEVSAARAKYFRPPYPASTMIEVSRLVSPDQLVEIEAVAALTPRPPPDSPAQDLPPSRRSRRNDEQRPPQRETRHSMRVLTNEDVERVLDPAECLRVLEVAYKEHATGAAANRPRNHTYFPVEDPRHPGFRYRFKSQEGGNVASGVWALRITSDMAGVEVLAGGVRRRRLLPVATGGTFCGLITLYSMERLEPLAIIHDSYIQKMRVGATSALGIRELANEDVSVAGLFGSGWQAQSHLQYLLRVRPSVQEVRVYSPTPEHRREFARVWSERTGRRIVAVDDPHDAVAGCKIVTCATAGFDPCFDGAALEAGTHVTCITSPDGTAMRRELDDATFDRADQVTVLSREQVHHDNQVDILGPVERGRKTLDEIVELGELLLDKSLGRKDPVQITVFANNTGMGLQFAAVGAYALRRCEEEGLGHTIPTEWFLERTSP